MNAETGYRYTHESALAFVRAMIDIHGTDDQYVRGLINAFWLTETITSEDRQILKDEAAIGNLLG